MKLYNFWGEIRIEGVNLTHRSDLAYRQKMTHFAPLPGYFYDLPVFHPQATFKSHIKPELELHISVYGAKSP
jgi:hypothetical protein